MAMVIFVVVPGLEQVDDPEQKLLLPVADVTNPVVLFGEVGELALPLRGKEAGQGGRSGEYLIALSCHRPHREQLVPDEEHLLEEHPGVAQAAGHHALFQVGDLHGDRVDQRPLAADDGVGDRVAQCRWCVTKKTPRL
jgi:hypothetical protein